MVHYFLFHLVLWMMLLLEVATRTGSLMFALVQSIEIAILVVGLVVFDVDVVFVVVVDDDDVVAAALQW
jgi:hypothetical protein